MKKLASLLMAILMIATLSTTAFATSITPGTATNNGTAATEIQVTGKYIADATPTVISAEISWDPMEFTLIKKSNGNWNPSTHMYTGATGAEWDDDTKNITVKNHSNVPISATISFNKNEAVSFAYYINEQTNTSDTFTLEAPEKSTSSSNISTAPSKNTTFRIQGMISEDCNLGTLTIAISQNTTT